MGWLKKYGESHRCDLPDPERDLDDSKDLLVGDRWRCDVCNKIYIVGLDFHSMVGHVGQKWSEDGEDQT